MQVYSYRKTQNYGYMQPCLNRYTMKYQGYKMNILLYTTIFNFQSAVFPFTTHVKSCKYHFFINSIYMIDTEVAKKKPSEI